ncbi:MAG: mechanosensitive ion channel family protein [Acidobacteriota bacterium]
MQAPAAPDLPSNWPEIALALGVAALVSSLAALAAGRVTRRVFAAVNGPTALAGTALGSALVANTVRLVRLAAFGIVLTVVAFPALDLAGVPTPVGIESADLGRWAAETGVRIAGLLVLAFALARLIALVTARAVAGLPAAESSSAIERQKRAQTIAGLARKALTMLIWAIAGLMVLREFDVDITPVLTGAGIVGLGVGFGAQTLVRDVISGFFLILEDQVRVGDIAEVNGRSGMVEQVNLRTIVLRDLEGAVHIFPNGAITALTNRSKDFAFALVDVPMEYGADTDVVTAAVVAASEELRLDPAFAPLVLEPLEVLGVDAFGDSQMTIRVRMKTVPARQWMVARELRRRIKKVFDARGIQIPFPQLTVWMPRDSGRPLSD